MLFIICPPLFKINYGKIKRVISCGLFITLALSFYSLSALEEEEIIDITGLSYGRLKLAMEFENSPGTDVYHKEKIIKLFGKHLIWSGLFDLRSLYDDFDLRLKILYIPDNQLKAWIFSHNSEPLITSQKSLKEGQNFDQVILELVEEIIFRLTGEKSIFRSAIIYVEKDQSRRYRLILTDAFGTKKVILLDDGKLNILPRWSPDASSVMYTSLGQNGSSIKQIILENMVKKTIFSNLGKTSGGTWGSNGQQAIITLSRDGNSDLYMTNLNGTDVKRLTFRSSLESNPRWSPDGNRLLFVSNRSTGVQIYQRNLKTGEEFRMTFSGYYNVEPNWSNDGAFIVYVGHANKLKHIFLMDKEGEYVQKLTRGNISAEQPVWSPNGRQILFIAKSGSDQKLFIIRADGTFKRRLTKSPAGINEFNPTWTINYKWPKNTR